MLIEAPELSSVPGIRHAFFTREGGVSAGLYGSLNGGLGSADDPAAVAQNRARMADELGLAPNGLVSLHQVHSADAIRVDGPWRASDRPRVDGMATAAPRLGLAVATADCGPVLFADPGSRVVGAAHAGWKGALGGILEATIARMEELGAKRGRIVAVLGPTIGPDAYEVGPEFVERFAAADEENRRFFRPSDRPGHARFDLPAFILHRLGGAGIGESRWLELCTYSDERRFYSYRRATHRREPDYGRLISAISVAT